MLPMMSKPSVLLLNKQLRNSSLYDGNKPAHVSASAGFFVLTGLLKSNALIFQVFLKKTPKIFFVEALS